MDFRILYKDDDLTSLSEFPPPEFPVLALLVSLESSEASKAIGLINDR